MKGPVLFLGEIGNKKIAKIHLLNFKNSSPEPLGQFQVGTKHPWINSALIKGK